MKEWKVGDRVQISDTQSEFCGYVGKMVKKSAKGWWILLDGERDVLYFPWGYDIPRGDAR